MIDLLETKQDDNFNIYLNPISKFLYDNGIEQKEAINYVNNLCEQKYKKLYSELSLVQKKDLLKLCKDFFRINIKTTIQELELKSIIDKRFYESNILEEIHKELDRDHKLDHKQKIATLLVCLTSYLKDSNDRCSCALKGESSAGKDSCIKTILKHIPEEDWFLLTRATSSALEDSIENKRIIAFSEINKHRENGANSELTETYKQISEGGVNVIKKDASTGYKTTINVKSEQKTLLYGTTETESDEELETRHIVIPIKSSYHKNKIVVTDVLAKVSDENYYLKKYHSTESWIAQGIRLLNKDVQVIIPYASCFIDQLESDQLFDLSKDRVKRDIKRLLNLVKATTWLYQLQRTQKEISGQKFIYSEPQDLLIALEIVTEFFNLSYSGLDHRIKEVYDQINQLQGTHDSEIISMGYDISKYSGWVVRHLLAEKLGISSTNTIKKRLRALMDLGLIDSHYDQSIPRGYLIKGINQGINRVLKGISITAFDTLLTGWLTTSKKEIYGKNILKPIRTPYFDKILVYSVNNLTPSNLTPSKVTGSTHSNDNLIEDEERIFEPIRDKPKYILELLSEVEMTIDELFLKVKDNISIDELENIIQKLQADGNIYAINSDGKLKVVL